MRQNVFHELFGELSLVHVLESVHYNVSPSPVPLLRRQVASHRDLVRYLVIFGTLVVVVVVVIAILIPFSSRCAFTTAPSLFKGFAPSLALRRTAPKTGVANDATAAATWATSERKGSMAAEEDTEGKGQASAQHETQSRLVCFEECDDDGNGDGNNDRDKDKDGDEDEDEDDEENVQSVEQKKPTTKQHTASDMLENARGKGESNMISLDKLQELRLAFELADEDGGGGLDMEEFLNAFGHILGDNLSQRQLSNLFMKIDANSDGTVDWQEFTEFMLLENKGTELMEKEEIKCQYEPQEFEEPVENAKLHHTKRIISTRVLHDMGGVYATCSEDGSVRLWQATKKLAFARTITHNPERPIRNSRRASAGEDARAPGGGTLSTGARQKGKGKQKAPAAASESSNVSESVASSSSSPPPSPSKTSQLRPRESMCPVRYQRAAAPAWANDCCFMKESNTLAVATSDRVISFYDTSLGFDCVGRIRPLPNNPLALAYYQGPLSEGREVLACIDDIGFVHVWHLDPARWLFADTDVDIASRTRVPQGVNRYFRLRVHQDRGSKILIDDTIGAIVSCSSDGVIAFLDIERRRVLRRFQCHEKAVYDFAWIARNKLIASAGIERRILFWNPFTCAVNREINDPDEIDAPILGLCFNETEHQLIALNERNVARVWDLVTFYCVQQITFAGPGLKSLSGMVFDEHLQQLVVFDRELHVRHAKVVLPAARKSHQFPVTAALFNESFHQLVSAAGTEIHVWDVFTGSLSFRFLHPHDKENVTSVCFDTGGRRLFTGAHDGTIKVWNFNNGACLGEFTKTVNGEKPPLISITDAEQEVTSLACFTDIVEGNGYTVENTYLVATGWDRRVFIFKEKDRDVTESDLALPLPEHVEKAHQDDVNCVVYCGHNTIATAADDGRLLLWSLSSGFLKGRSGHTPSARLLMKPGAYEEHRAGAARRQLLYALDPGSSPFLPSGLQAAGAKKTSMTNCGLALACESEMDFDNDDEIEDADIGDYRRLVRQSTVAAPMRLDASLRARSNNMEAIMPDRRLGLERRATELGGFAKQAEIDFLASAAEKRRKRIQLRGVPRPDRLAIEGLVYLQRLNCLATSGADGFIRFWDHVHGKMLFELDGQHDAAASIAALATDKDTNAYLFAGDTSGIIKVWNLAHLDKGVALERAKFKLSSPRNEWQAHNETLVNIQYVRWSESVSSPLDLVVTTSTDCTVMLWTIDGASIGMFGQEHAWSLGSALSWAKRKTLIVHRAKKLGETVSVFHSNTTKLKSFESVERAHDRIRDEANEYRERNEVDGLAILRAKTRNKFKLNYMSDVRDRERFLQPDPTASMSSAQLLLLSAAKARRKGPREFAPKPSQRALLHRDQIMHRVSLPELAPVAARGPARSASALL
ncbi:WD repeat-containing protein 64 [Hondaea fermentalgiana]|uniref:WD repeat-containing protein 64 n=1 Tax=Hondaea fermentalgiana TaxID=2315210 RepID=A0A2R5G3L2_9STRA|nr:WD repeat-containing protein 64 [Hondaea fermentalgiana]|eukprot:GBG25627.1 WD repeat-containing protein 64 [Hondaea fermentalgiana]